MNLEPNRLPRRQRGAVLFVALVFLLLVTLLALTAMGTSILQEKMTGGMRNRQLAEMGAESALRGTEAWLWTLNFTNAPDAASGEVIGQPLPPCIATSAHTCVQRPERNGGLKADVQSFRTSRTWVQAPRSAPRYRHTLTGLTGDAETASLATQPEVMLEDMGRNVPPGYGNQDGAIDPENLTAMRFYRITTRSQGGSAATSSVTESVFSSSNLTDTGIEAGSP